MGILQKTAKFLGIDKFGQGLASTGRVLSGHVSDDIQNQQNVSSMNQKVLYALQKETDPAKRQHLQEFMQRQNFGNADTSVHTQQDFAGANPQASQIDPGLNLTNKQVLGSAANVALNVATPGAFKGSTAAVIAKNAALGGAFGAASGLEKNRSAGGIVGSTLGGAAIGGAVGAVGLMAKAAKEFVGNAVPEWMMNKAVKPALQDLKKNVRFGSDTLGKELLDEGVKGGPKKLLEIADTKQNEFEQQLQSHLNSPAFAEVTIKRDAIFPHLREMVAQKSKLPGGRNDLLKLREIYNDLPEQMTLPQANEIKRAIYQELRDPAYRLDANLSTKSQTLKVIAKGLKTELENEGGPIVGELNRKLSIYGRLENSMVDQLARNMRNNGLGLTDAILLAGGDTGVLALLRHVGQNVETHAAQALHTVADLGTGTLGKAFKGGLKRATLNAP